MVEKEYGIKDIQSLDFREGVRKRVSMYLGTNDNDGTYQALKEIINNSTDEALGGFGDKIDIELDEKKNSISIRDYGRGVPFGLREDGENVLISIYTKSHTGGKFNSEVYKNVSGLNGVGGSCVCLSSSEFTVESYRDGKAATAKFKEGLNISYKETPTKNANGTFVKFTPDPQVFNNGEIGFTFDRISEDLKNISYLYNGIEFNLREVNSKKKIRYKSQGGIKDFVKDHITKPLHKTIMYGELSDGVDKIEIAFQWGSGRGESHVFVNGLKCPEGGTPITGAKTGLTKTFNNLAKTTFDGELIRQNLFYVINCSVAAPSFANQTKSKINNANLRTMASNLFSSLLKEMKVKNQSEYDILVELFKKVAKADAAAERARAQVLNATRDIEKNQKKKVFASDKLKDAEFLGENSVLLLVEGNSAAASMAIARDSSKFGILALRGKMLNCLSNPEEKIFENEEIKLILSALGVTPGKYNPKKLRYGKVGICVDGDSDGRHVALLIMSALRYLCPQFIDENRLYWLKAPLYVVENKNRREYYYSDLDFNNRIKKTGDVINRSKGLGSLSATQAKESMFGINQKLDLLKSTPEAILLLEELMGEDIQPRKDFVLNNIDFSTITE